MSIYIHNYISSDLGKPIKSMVFKQIQEINENVELPFHSIFLSRITLLTI